MKIKLLLILLIVSSFLADAQQKSNSNSIKITNEHKEDASEVTALFNLSIQHEQSDSGLTYAQQGLALAKKINDIKGEADCNLALALNYGNRTNFNASIQYALNASHFYHDLKDFQDEAATGLILQGNYRETLDYTNSLYYAFQGEKLAATYHIYGNQVLFPGHRLAPLYLAEIGGTYTLMNKLDSALFYTRKSIQENELFNGVTWGFPVYLLATIEQMQGNYAGAMENYRLSIHLSIENGEENAHDTLQIFSGMSSLFNKTGKPDSAIHYAGIVVSSWNPEISEVKNLLEAVRNLAQAYKSKGKKDSALKYTELNLKLQDSIFSTEKIRELQNVAFNERIKQQEIASAQAAYKNKIQIYALAAGLLVVLLIAAMFWRNNNHRRKAYGLLQKQKQETDFQKTKAEKAFENLKSTQAQLIQSEKMASLGELTAGIAHEIQNPLNFVNNFSEVNREMVDELQKELKSGNVDEAIAISNDIKENEEKINHHGKRADAIVKGMLQHSRKSSGQKEPTDINTLCDEYLRLSFHGMRAKDKSFNADLETQFDGSIGKINIVPQDIGRVLLNLFNNAFYACSERSRSPVNKQKSTNLSEYKPTVSVSTKKIDKQVEIKVKDNGNGIPENIVDKIFQPFFTTKPTGEGTGLGLSLSYDIIKAHGGEIKVESREGEGSKFIIHLPGIFRE
jgi:two-component system NtrC family sensor kinase